jgi:hypothetical protein
VIERRRERRERESEGERNTRAETPKFKWCKPAMVGNGGSEEKYNIYFFPSQFKFISQC